MNWLRERLGERSTYAGLIAIVLAIALLVIPIILEGEKAAALTENVKWLIGALFASGLGAVIFKENGQ